MRRMALIFVLLVGGFAHADSAKDLTVQANEALKNGKATDALKLADQAISADPKFGPATGNTGPAIRIGFEGFDVFSLPPDQLGTCWPDYAIRP